MTTDAGTPRTNPVYARRTAVELERSLTAAETERDALRARVGDLEAGLRVLATAAEDCGVQHWDTDSQSDEVLFLVKRTEEARALLAPSSEVKP